MVHHTRATASQVADERGFPAGTYFENAWRDHAALCERLITEGGYTSVCEIGGGRNPLWSAERVADMGLAYTVMDVSAAELELCPPGFRTLHGDVCDPALAADDEQFDFMFSRMVAEHVASGAQMHENVFRLLRPGGMVFHFFPTLYAPVYVLNRLLPERLGAALQGRLAPRDQPKFPARYSMCRGPVPSVIAKLTSIGYDIDRYRPFYGNGYLRRVPPLQSFDDALARWAARRRNPYLTSYAYLVLRKPNRRRAAA